MSRGNFLPRMTNYIPLPFVAPRVAAQAVGWFSVSGWIATNPFSPKPELVRAPAVWVKVDGQPVTALALGQWAQLTAGQHVVTFQPSPELGAGPKTWTIDLSPQAHLQQQVPLPSAPLPVVPPHLRNP